MKTSKIHQLWYQGTEQLSKSTQELLRPKDDVVTLCVCQLSKQAISYFLRSYLAFKGILTEENYPIFLLLGKCAEFDKQFRDIDLSAINCQHLPMIEQCSTYCLSLNKVCQCHEVAENIRKIVRDKIDMQAGLT